MKRLSSVLTIFFLSSTCMAEVPSDTIYLPIVVSAQKFRETHLSTDQKTTLPKISVVRKPRFQQEDLIREEKSIARPPESHYAGFLSSVSKDYSIKKNRLSLTKVPYGRNKDAFVFVFFMNPPKETAEKPVWQNKSRIHMHVLGNKKIFEEQEVVENEYPIDFSTSGYEDGYSSDPNLVLPNKKPRKVLISLLWSF